MNRKIERTGAAMATWLLCALWIVPAHAHDELGTPPPLPADHVAAPPLTEQSVIEQLDLQTTRRFEAAAGSAQGQLSKQQARTAGWGFVSDHFSEIDRTGSGYVGLSDVLNFMAARTPQQRMRNAAGKAGS